MASPFSVVHQDADGHTIESHPCRDMEEVHGTVAKIAKVRILKPGDRLFIDFPFLPDSSEV